MNETVRCRRVQTAAQVGDVDLDDVGFNLRAETIEVRLQIALGYDLPALHGQVSQDTEFARTQVHGLALPPCPLRLGIHDQGTYFQT